MDAVHLLASDGLGRFTCKSQDTRNLTVIEGGDVVGIRLCFRQSVDKDAC
jgi:hypothetical protein